MFRVEFIVKVPVKVKKKGNLYISSCIALDIHTQGYSDQEAKQNLFEAIRLFISTCFERGTLHEVLKDCGFELAKPLRRALNEPNFMTVPIPFTAKGSCLSECRV